MSEQEEERIPLNIAVWFSCGAASAVAAKKTIELYPNDNIRIINNPVKEEHPDNMRFLRDVSEWLNHPIEFATNTKYPSTSCVDVWAKRRYMSGTKGAPCTFELKKKARHQWEAKNKMDYHVLGFTYDEKHRHKNFILKERENVLPVLIDLKLTKEDCFKVLIKAGIKLPEIYSMGFPNANCIGCVKATSPTYWNLVREKFPEAFKERAEQSRGIKCRLVTVKGKRTFLDELDPLAKGRKIKSWDCGTFCEEDT